MAFEVWITCYLSLCNLDLHFVPKIIVLNYKNLKFRIFGKYFCLTCKG